MFVVMALVTTFATTPLVSWLYPPWYQQKLESWRRGDIDWNGNRLNNEKIDTEATPSEIGEKTGINKVAVHLRLDTLPGVLALLALFARRTGAGTVAKVHPSKRIEESSTTHVKDSTFEIHGIRLKEIGDRESSVMKVSNMDDDVQNDPVLNTFRIAMGQIVQVAVRGIVLRCLPDSFSSALLECADDARIDMMLLAWSLSGNISEAYINTTDISAERFENGGFSQFMGKIVGRQANKYKTATFIDNGFGVRRRGPKQLISRKSTLSLMETETNVTPSLPLQDQGHHIFLPFFGTEDDVAALHLALQLARDPSVTATIVLFEHTDAISKVEAQTKTQETNLSVNSIHSVSTFQNIRDTLPEALSRRVIFETISISSSDSPLSSALAKGKLELGQNPKNAGDLVIVGRNADDINLRNSKGDWNTLEAGKTLGPVAGAILGSTEKINTSLLVVSAAGMLEPQHA